MIEKVEQYREELSALPQSRLEELSDEERTKQRLEDDQERFFNKSHAAADFEYWAKMPHWTLEEAVALSFGKNPKVVSWKCLEKPPIFGSPFVAEYARTRELAKRAVPWKKLYDPVLPSIFVNWAKENDLKFPEALAELVEARIANPINWEEQCKEAVEHNNNNVDKANRIIDGLKQRISELEKTGSEEKPLHTKERETLLKLVISMAVDGYGYDPSAKRSPIPREIADALAAKGISLDQDTVRRWLKEAAELLPSDNENFGS